MDKTFSDYYEKIAEILNVNPMDETLKLDSEKYYVQKIKPFFIKGDVYYEITLTIASNKANKFDRMIVFTKINIMSNYSIKIALKRAKINIFGRATEINIICNWSVAIRACEIKNFGKIIGINKSNYNVSDKEYWELMKILTQERYNLYNISMLERKDYLLIKQKIKTITSASTIFDMLDLCRNLFEHNVNGSNIIKYLLYKLNNKIIKDQYSREQCIKLNNLYLEWGCLPFEEMPYASSLKNHNPKIYDLYDVIKPSNKECELLANVVKSNIETKNKLYTSLDDLKAFDNISKLVKAYNDKLYYKHRVTRSLIIENNNIYINGYENDTISIINVLTSLTKEGIEGYKNSFLYFINNEKYDIDDEAKKDILINMYEDSKVSLVYGAAGTGKSTLIKHLSNFYENNTKLCLANTNPAVENLKRNVKSSNTEFKTIHSFLSDYNEKVEYDILIIDECSTVSNSDMNKILNKCSYKLILLVGDIYQIESISFGNWFSIAKTLIPDKAVHELNFTWRSEEKNLLTLWEMVRSSDDRIDEMLTKSEFSSSIDDTILNRNSEDEIILCLNYDGLYGINNINNYLQNINTNKSVNININTYKINDPIIFGDTTRFLPVIYNNMKGVIRDILEEENKVWFTIEINKVINELEIFHLDLKLIEVRKNSSLVKFYVDKYRNADEDDDEISSTWIVPFSIAYAVSIHKSQGLEYESVKILLTNEIDDLITHNIFYTAITRARKKLKIYWTPECQNKIISTIKHVDNGKDTCIIKTKL